MPIGYTRALLRAALSARSIQASYHQDPVFNLDVPNECPGVPAEVLVPRKTWADASAYERAGRQARDDVHGEFQELRERRLGGSARGRTECLISRPSSASRFTPSS